jgi:rhodanese-related sulfurtransferase
MKRAMVEILLVLSTGSLLGLIFSRVSTWESSRTRPVQALRVGSQITIPDVDFADHERTVVLAIAASCRYCMTSIPFHQKLVRAATRNGIPLVVLTEKNRASNPASLLDSIGARDATAIEVDLAALGIEGTPSIFGIDSHGSVTGLWVGELLPRHEHAVLQWVGNPTMDAIVDVLANGETTTQLVNNFSCCGANQTLLDLRERKEYREIHRPGAVNIPFKELLVRAHIEIPVNRQIIIDCSNLDSTPCSIGLKLLRKSGFTSVRLLNPWARTVACQTLRASAD